MFEEVAGEHSRQTGRRNRPGDRAILLWKMFLANTKNLAARLAFFIPVSWLLFQLQYVETLGDDVTC